MKKFFLSLLLGISAFVSAQNTLKGTVIDINNTKIAGVNVILPELHKETKTNNEGQYILNNLPNGTFVVVFSSDNFDMLTTKVTLNQKETIFDTTLLENHSHHLEDVIVSTAFNKTQKQNVMKVEHSSIKALQQKGATTLIEGLATIPGVSQFSTGTSIGKPVIRGLSGNRVLVYTQGVRLENQQFGEEHGLGLNDNAIESVEVIKGPASLLYGSDALGGVLYFNPEKFANANTHIGNFKQKYFSNTQGSSTSFGFKSSDENWKFLFGGSHILHADYQLPSKDRVLNTRFNETDAKLALGYSNSSFSTTFRYNINYLNLGLHEHHHDDEHAEESEEEHNEEHEDHISTTPENPKQRVLGQILSLNNVFYLKNSKIEANIGFITNKRKEFEESSIASLNMNLQTLNYDLKYHLPKLGKLETIFGVQGMNQTNKNSGVELLIPDAKTNDLGVLVTSMYQWDKNTFQVGFRYDTRHIKSEAFGSEGEEKFFQAIDKKFNSFNASLGYKTNFTEKIEARFNVASGFRAPNLAELTSNGIHHGNNRYEIGNAELKNEQNIQGDLNLEYNDTHFEFFVNGFYNHIANYIYVSPTGNSIDDINVFEYTQSNARLYGGEVGIHLHPHPIDWLHFTSSFESVIGQKDNGDSLPLIPANRINNLLKVNFKDGKVNKDTFIACGVNTTLPQNRISEFETSTGDYTLVNLALGSEIKIGKFKFEASINANNIFDKAYFSHLSRLKSEGIYNMGRNIIFGLNFNI